MPDIEPIPTEEFAQTLSLYKLYLATAEKVSDRRGSANQWLLSVNSAIVGLYGFISAGREIGGPEVVEIWRWAIPAAGILVSFAWTAILQNYRKLNAAKFSVLQEIETAMPRKLFTLEEVKYRDARRVDLTRVEAFIPLSFAVLYAVLLWSVI